MRLTTPAKKLLVTLVGLSACALLASGCGLRSASGAVLTAQPGSVKAYPELEGKPLTVAAKDFTEQLVLGNMMSTVLSTAGFDVTNLTNTPGSFGVRQAVLKGDVDISPEYTGTGWINYLGNEKPVKGEEAQYQAVLDADKKNGLTWLPPAPMNNTYAFAIREAKAEELGITKLSQLKDLPKEELTFCVESEFAKRNDGFQPMLKAYGLSDSTIAGSTNLDTGVIYTATADGKPCNFGEVFTTDGRIPGLKLRVLEDDKQFFPLYNLTEVVRTDVLEEYPEIEEIFSEINPKLTNEVMLDLNAKVDVEGQDPAIVAKDWLVSEGFVKE
ncbi:glycine betaine ABC transporter substrate-binding protein [Solicola sp. PLA-1-18]|uniref:glycine betaine ABC transporter substrate-binding protein n=1 Tax=Solicola sp. PLA-1-18 TaxID=3380532 RepID=UPI003B81560A